VVGAVLLVGPVLFAVLHRHVGDDFLRIWWILLLIIWYL